MGDITPVYDTYGDVSGYTDSSGASYSDQASAQAAQDVINSGYGNGPGAPTVTTPPTTTTDPGLVQNADGSVTYGGKTYTMDSNGNYVDSSGATLPGGTLAPSTSGLSGLMNWVAANPGEAAKLGLTAAALLGAANTTVQDPATQAKNLYNTNHALAHTPIDITNLDGSHRSFDPYGSISVAPMQRQQIAYTGNPTGAGLNDAQGNPTQSFQTPNGKSGPLAAAAFVAANSSGLNPQQQNYLNAGAQTATPAELAAMTPGQITSAINTAPKNGVMTGNPTTDWVTSHVPVGVNLTPAQMGILQSAGANGGLSNLNNMTQQQINDAITSAKTTAPGTPTAVNTTPVTPATNPTSDWVTQHIPAGSNLTSAQTAYLQSAGNTGGMTNLNNMTQGDITNAITYAKTHYATGGVVDPNAYVPSSVNSNYVDSGNFNASVPNAQSNPLNLSWLNNNAMTPPQAPQHFADGGFVGSGANGSLGPTELANAASFMSTATQASLSEEIQSLGLTRDQIAQIPGAAELLWPGSSQNQVASPSPAWSSNPWGGANPGSTPFDNAAPLSAAEQTNAASYLSAATPAQAYAEIQKLHLTPEQSASIPGLPAMIAATPATPATPASEVNSWGLNSPQTGEPNSPITQTQIIDALQAQAARDTAGISNADYWLAYQRQQAAAAGNPNIPNPWNALPPVVPPPVVPPPVVPPPVVPPPVVPPPVVTDPGGHLPYIPPPVTPAQPGTGVLTPPMPLQRSQIAFTGDFNNYGAGPEHAYYNISNPLYSGAGSVWDPSYTGANQKADVSNENLSYIPPNVGPSQATIPVMHSNVAPGALPASPPGTQVQYPGYTQPAYGSTGQYVPPYQNANGNNAYNPNAVGGGSVPYQFDTQIPNAQAVDQMPQGNGTPGNPYFYSSPANPQPGVMYLQASGGSAGTGKIQMGEMQGPLSILQGAQGQVRGTSPGQADDVNAKLSHGEYIMDSSTVADLGDGNTEAGAAALDKMRENIRRHKRSAPPTKIPPKAKSPEAYLRGGKA